MAALNNHFRKTEKLARKLKPSSVFQWLVTKGYFPEGYVLPPCFYVSKNAMFPKRFFPFKRNSFKPRIAQVCELHFPKTDLTDRTFGIIDPEIHSDIAREIASNWTTVLDILFKAKRKILSYSFPVPLDAQKPGALGGLRAGRLIYEWIEMAENDLVEEAYAYKYIVRSDIKNFYPSVYTHSIAWALHSKSLIRQNRNDYQFPGNRLDKLFQNANDGCTNGLPIGPVVSDLIAELILSIVDASVSRKLRDLEVLGVRFKDDYRILCKSTADCKKAIKVLQQDLKAVNLVLNEEKTSIHELPEGIFREWRSKYDAVRPKRGKFLHFTEFKELYLNVLRIDQDFPGTGVIDKFLGDLTNRQYQPLIPVSKKHMGKIISLLLLLGERRIRSFPRVLGVIEAVMVAANNQSYITLVKNHLNEVLHNLCKDPEDNRYLISWILYFLSSNQLAVGQKQIRSTHPVIKSIQLNHGLLYDQFKDFVLFRDIKRTRRAGPLLRHLDVFRPL